MKIKLIQARSFVRMRVLFMIMRTFIFLLCTTVFGITTEKSFSQEKVTIDADKVVSVDEVFDIIQNQTRYRFLYPDDLFTDAPKVQLKKGEIRVDELLKQSLSKSAVEFDLSQKNRIVIRERKSIDKSGELFLQQKFEVSGTVTDLTGQPLPGASIVEKGTANGTQTDFDGNFTLELDSADATLVVSYIGFATREILLDGQISLTVVLEESAAGLEEVVVVGYGTVQRKDLTTSISTVKAEEISKITTASFDQALKGMAPGLFIAQSQGAPGAQPDIRIRGTNSISAGTAPLYVIDGLVIPNNSGSANAFDVDQATPGATNIFATINPDDIESIEVLKDAAATAIYGARGSNGVIIVNTKRGKSGQAKINFDYYTAISNISKDYPLTNAAQYITIANRYTDANGANRLFTDADLENYSLTGGTDWQNAVFRTAITQNFSLSASGGTDKFSYFLSGSYYDEEGIVIDNDLNRFSIRANLDATLGKFKLGNSMTASYTTNNDIPYGIDRNPQAGPTVISSVLQMPPTDPIFNTDGSYFVFPTRSAQAITNPVAIAKTQEIQYKTLRSLGNFFVEYTIFDGLKLRSSLGYDIFSRSDGVYFPKETTLLGSELGGVARRASTLNLTWLNENTLSYNKEFGNHKVNAVIGTTFQGNHLEGVFAGSSNFITDGFQSYNLEAGASDLPPGSILQEWQVSSFLGRVAYDYKARYLLTFSGRYDGSSRLGPNDRYDFFPAVSGAWRISDEPFFDGISDKIDYLKLRTSYGVGGNDQIGNYASFPSFSTTSVQFGSTSATGVIPGSFGNQDIKWERTTQLDIGLDATFFNNVLSLTADYYDKTTTDLLAPRVLASESGFSNITVNAGEIKNSGFELELGSTFNLGEFAVDLNANASFEKNKFISLGEFNQADTLRTGNTARIVGKPLGTWFIPQFKGIYQIGQEAEAAIYNKEVGDPIIEDINEDGQIVPLDDFRATDLSTPNKYFGFNGNVRYEGWDLGFFFQGAFGHRIYNRDFSERGYRINQGLSNFYTSLLDAWTPQNPSNAIPRLNANINHLVHSGTVQKADYVRLQNVTIGYNFDKKVLDKLNVSKLRLYLSGQNLATFTKYDGLNPEAFNDNGSYPLSRTYRIGVNISL